MTDKQSVDMFDEGSGLRVLAEALPAMIRAMAEPGRRRKDLRLGGISHRIAEHLRAEICSIFFITEATDGKRKLVLEEAYGYGEHVVGEEKSLTSGLTSKMVKAPAEIIANFVVQDHADWKGEFDPALEWHCWCLLGVPIIGANNLVKGVIKVENKRSDWSKAGQPTFIKRPGGKNTPKEILSAVEDVRQKAASLVQKHGTQADTGGRHTFIPVEQLRSLAQSLHDACNSLSDELIGESKGVDDRLHGTLRKLSVTTQERELQSAKWHTQAMIVLLHRLREELGPDIHAEVDLALALLEAIELALSAYRPFSREDLYLMRTVGAMIAAALDIREAAHVEVFRTLEHAIRGPGSNLLQIVSRLTEELVGLNDDQKADLGHVYTLALYISGPQALLRGWWSDQSETREFGKLYDSDLENRCHYYDGFAKLHGKTFVFPKDVSELAQDVTNARILNNPEIIIGALDILFVNAIEHGGNAITLTVDRIQDKIRLTLKDNGGQFPATALTELQSVTGRYSGNLFSPRGGVGLKFAKHALSETRMALELALENEPAVGAVTVARITIPVSDK